MRASRRTVVTLLAALFFGAPHPTHAAVIFEDVGFVSPVLLLNPSVRSAAMGDAGTADVWDVAPNPWANPALVASTQGIRYETGAYEELGEWRTRRTTLGCGGVGFSTTGLPIGGLGQLEYETGFTIFDGTTTSRSGLLERAKTWTLGVSLGGLVTTLARMTGSEPPGITRTLDVALGYGENHLEEEFWFDDLGGVTRTSESAVAHDLGLLVRTGVPLRLGRMEPGRLEAAYGFARIRAGHDGFFGWNRNVAADRNGVALNARAGGAAWASAAPTWLAAGLSPLVSAGWAMDFVHAGHGRDDTEGWGAELGLANVLFGRIGRVEATHTWGLGVQLPVGRYGGVRWDHAVVPRTFIEDLHRDAWTLWIDPFRIYRAAQ